MRLGDSVVFKKDYKNIKAGEVLEVDKVVNTSVYLKHDSGWYYLDEERLSEYCELKPKTFCQTIEKKDGIVEKVVTKYQQRSKVGIKKYGTTLEENNKDNFLVHLQEELMDATLYIEKLLSRLHGKS